jgi:hypothetical protein
MLEAFRVLSYDIHPLSSGIWLQVARCGIGAQSAWGKVQGSEVLDSNVRGASARDPLNPKIAMLDHYAGRILLVAGIDQLENTIFLAFPHGI